MYTIKYDRKTKTKTLWYEDRNIDTIAGIIRLERYIMGYSKPHYPVPSIHLAAYTHPVYYYMGSDEYLGIKGEDK